MKIKEFLFYWLPVIAYAGLIFYMSSLSHPPSPGFAFSYMDKIEHMLEYFVLSALLLRGLLYSAAKRPYLTAVVLSVLYGISDEVHQLFVAGRVFSGWDIMADALGACLVLVSLLIQKKMKRNKRFKERKYFHFHK